MIRGCGPGMQSARRAWAGGQLTATALSHALLLLPCWSELQCAGTSHTELPRSGTPARPRAGPAHPVVEGMRSSHNPNAAFLLRITH
jgi:hypothetical protein